MVRGREEATVCKGNSREDGSVVGGERWLQNGSSMYMYICLYTEVYGAVLGCCGQSVCWGSMGRTRRGKCSICT